MAYLPMTQEVIKFMNNSFDKEDIVSYQMLITLFGNLFANEKDFLSDPSDRMGLSHFVESFLRTNNFQTIVTIKDLNLIFNNNTKYDIYDIELYKVFFVLIYEELSSNDPQISYKIKESVFNLINLIEESVNQIEQEQEHFSDTIKTESRVFDNNDFRYQPRNDRNNEPVMSNRNNEPVINNRNNEFIMNNRNNRNNEPIMNERNNRNDEPSMNNLTVQRDEHFVIHNKFYLHDYIKTKNLLPYECDVCGLTEWQNQPLKLELDSFDGTYSNLKLGNLRFLCPNCYSQIGHY